MKIMSALRKFGEAMDTVTLDTEIQKMRERELEYKAAQKKADVLKDEYKIQEKIVLQLLDESGKENYYVDGLGLATKVSKDSYYYNKAGSKEFLDSLLEKVGPDAFYNMVSVHHATLTSFIKAEKEIDENYKPPGMYEPVTKHSIKIKRSSK